MDTDNELTDRRAAFVEHYCVLRNGTQAAIAAGYAASGAGQEGYRLLKNADVRAAIDERMKVLSMSADEAVKHVSDIAATRLNDFLKIEVRQRGTTIQQPLGEAIEELSAEIAFEQEYTRRSLQILSFDEEGLKRYQAERKAVVDRIMLKRLKLELLLEENPNATQDIPGPPESYEAVNVDMIALAKANEHGRIKSLSWGEFGPKVEMYDALAANRDILKLAGRFVERTDITSGGKAITATVEVVPAGPAIATDERETDV